MFKEKMGDAFLFTIGCYNKLTQKQTPIASEQERKALAQKLLNMTLEKNDGKKTSLKDFSAQAYLVVNTASKCGFTDQYEGLEELHKNYQAKGLQVLGFPSNDFGGQEPGTAEEIQSFCQINYGVSFPLFQKGKVKGENKQDFFKNLLAQCQDTSEIRWNFEKFLLDANGQVIQRYASTKKPQDLKKDIQALLA